MPTETVYGLAADAENELAVRRVFAVKGRPSTHPLIVHVGSTEAARSWVQRFPPLAERLAEAFWPGPLTLVLERSPRASDAVTGGQGTLALRVPRHPLALELLREFGGGLAAPSANRFGRVSPTRAEHVRADLGDDVELILDGGPAEVGVESTIVDLTSPSPVLLRPGGVAREDLERVLGGPLVAAEHSTVRAPGMLAAHYAPRTGVVVVRAEEVAGQVRGLLEAGIRVAVLGPESLAIPKGVKRLTVPQDPAALARGLYSLLRELDTLDVDVGVMTLPSREGLGLAIADRILRAAASRP